MPRLLFAGADVRECPAEADPAWDADRRSRFLLRDDVLRPLSVDPIVWRGRVGPDGRPLNVPSPWITPHDVRRGLARSAPDNPGRWVVVVIGIAAADAREEEILARERGITAEVQVQPGWQFMGYDIADGGGISGLSNCGYTEREARVLRAGWASRLNERGLFSELVDALALRTLTDQRVAEHAPFAVCPLWIIGP
jgi:hypothetical protein